MTQEDESLTFSVVQQLVSGLKERDEAISQLQEA